MVFPTDLSAVVDNVDDVLADHVNALEVKVGVDESAVKTSLDYFRATSWVEDPDTGVYVGTHSFKIEGKDVTVRFTKGTRIRYKQGGAYEYGVVILSAFSTDTTITLATNTDYALADAEITDLGYSYAVNPQGYPDWFSFTSTLIGFSSVTYDELKFKITGRQVFIGPGETDSHLGGTSNTTAFTFSVPVAPNRHFQLLAFVGAQDNSTNLAHPGQLYVTSGSTTVTAYKEFYAGTWTNSGTKKIWLPIISYPF